MSNNSYSINPVSRGVNNFFESLCNSSNPTYIQPIQHQNYTSQPEPTYHAPQTYTPTELESYKTYKYPTVTYNPQSLHGSYYTLDEDK